MDGAAHFGKLSEIALSDSSEIKRRNALAYLRKDFPARAKDTAIHALSDPSWMVRKEAIKAMAAAGTTANIGMIERSLQDPDPEVMLAAALAVEKTGRVGSRNVMESLLANADAPGNARLAAFRYLAATIQDAVKLRDNLLVGLHDMEMIYLLSEQVPLDTKAIIAILSLPGCENMAELMDFSLPVLAARKAKEAVPLLRKLLAAPFEGDDYRNSYEKHAILDTLDSIGWNPEPEEEEIRKKTMANLKESPSYDIFKRPF